MFLWEPKTTGSHCSPHWPLGAPRHGLCGLPCTPLPSLGLSRRSTSSSLGPGGGEMVEEEEEDDEEDKEGGWRVAVLPKRLWPSRDEPDDRVDTRLTGLRPGPSRGSPQRRGRAHGRASTQVGWCSLAERGERS